MTTLFDRAWNITVGDVEVSRRIGAEQRGLDVEFTVKKTTKREPNTCVLKIWNLAPDTRKRLTDPKAVTVRVEAGYGKQVSQLYLGEVRALAPGEKEGTDIVTELTSGDGEKATQGKRLAVPVGAKASAGDVLRSIARELGLGLGNVNQMATKLATKGLALYPKGTVIHGNAARALDDYCRSAGLEWSIQDGALQILDRGAALDSRPYILKYDSGLLGSPKLDKDGHVTANVLMVPELRPGLRVQIESLAVNGLFRLIQVDYKGSTFGNDWGMTITGERPKAAK
jgi:hypothetical protein